MKRYTFRYLVRTGIDNSVVGSGQGIIESESAGLAAPAAIEWALENNYYADRRIDPWIQLLELSEIAEDSCGQCWRCMTNHQFMIVCVECGNKRCPKANDHDNECTHSNDLGQPGSAYEHGAGGPSVRRLSEVFGQSSESQETS